MKAFNFAFNFAYEEMVANRYYIILVAVANSFVPLLHAWKSSIGWGSLDGLIWSSIVMAFLFSWGVVTTPPELKHRRWLMRGAKLICFAMIFAIIFASGFFGLALFKH